MKDELNLEALDEIIAGAPKSVAEENAINNASAYRKEQIERLKKEKATLEQLKESDELSLDELDNVRAGIRK